MDLDFDHALDGLYDTILTFDFSNFANKDIVPLKSNMFWRVYFLIRLLTTWKLILTWPQGKKIVFGCLKTEHAHNFLVTIPIDGLGQHMSPVEYRTIIRYCLMIPLFSKDEVCPVCCKACLDTLGGHATHYRELLKGISMMFSGWFYYYFYVILVVFSIQS
jgi:hypothetical protein